MKLKHINREISHLATMEAKNYISNHGLEQLKEFEYLKSLHEEKVKNLSLSGVSQQRELLIASKEALKYLESKNEHNRSAWTIIDTLKKAINCG
jgi:hypothetical protein